MDEREKRFSPGGYRDLLTVAYPLVVTSASMTLMHFVDRMFLAWYSQSAIAAVLPAGLTSFTLVSFFMGTSGYTTAIVAQHYGAKEHKKCARATWQGIFFSLLAEIILLFFIPLGSPIFTWGGHSPELISLETTYYTVLMLGGGVVPLNNAIASFFVGRGETKVTMVANVVGHATNVLLNYVLIFGKWGFPEMGIKGAAIATVISSTIPPAIMIALFLNSRNHEVYRTRSQCRFDAALFKKLIKFGAPAGIHFTLEMSAFTLFLLLVGRIGTLELAVTNISFSINTVAFMPMIGLSLATTTLVGQYIGRQDMYAHGREEHLHGPQACPGIHGSRGPHLRALPRTSPFCL
jgi:MATE family multidrug resistance protein